MTPPIDPDCGAIARFHPPQNLGAFILCHRLRLSLRARNVINASHRAAWTMLPARQMTSGGRRATGDSVGAGKAVRAASFHGDPVNRERSTHTG